MKELRKKWVPYSFDLFRKSSAKVETKSALKIFQQFESVLQKCDINHVL